MAEVQRASLTTEDRIRLRISGRQRGASAVCSEREMKKLRMRAKAVGLEIRKVGGKFRLWNVQSGAWLDRLSSHCC
jgi:hypothetical protein